MRQDKKKRDREQDHKKKHMRHEQLIHENKAKIISIRTKLLGIILPVVIVIVVILVGISYSISRTTIEEAAENLLNTSVENQVSAGRK